MRMTKHWSFWTWTTATLPQVTHWCNCVQFGGFDSTQENVDMSIQNDAGCSRRWYLTETITCPFGPQSGEATSAIMPLKTDMSGTSQKRLQEQKSFNSISKPLDHWWAVSDRLWMPPTLGWCARSLESFCVTADHIFLLGSGPHPRMSEPQHEIAWSWKWRSEWEITLMLVLHVTCAHSDTMFEQMFSGWDFHWELHWLSEHGALKPDRKSHNQDFTSWCSTMFCWVHSDCWDIDTIVCARYWRYVITSRIGVPEAVIPAWIPYRNGETLQLSLTGGSFSPNMRKETKTWALRMDSDKQPPAPSGSASLRDRQDRARYKLKVRST